MGSDGPKKPALSELTDDELEREFARASRVLAEVARRKRKDSDLGLLSAMERSVGAAQRRGSRDALKALLDNLDPEDDSPKACRVAVFSDDCGFGEDFVERVRELLLGGEVETVITELTQCAFLVRGAKRQALVDLRRYYSNNKDRMRYDEYLAKGIPIGSGIVESGHRHVIQKRMKGAGMRWSYRRAQRMVRLRCHHQSAGPQKFFSGLLRAHRLTRTGDIPQVGWKKTRASRAG